MEYKSHYIFLLKYNIWANSNIANILKENKITKGKEVEYFSHIVNAEMIWLGRIKKISDFLCEPFIVRSLEECIALTKSNNKDWIGYINTLQEDEFNNLIEYKNLKGENCVSKIWEITSHMLNHSTYHRAQIALTLRNSGITPANTDLIGFTRIYNS